ncbi:MAG: hypothetical protein R3F59_17715 [Myxococcota bacterium]
MDPVLDTLSAAASGERVAIGSDLTRVLASITPDKLQLLVIDAPLAPPGALEVVMSVCPHVRAIVVTEIVSEAQLVSAIRMPRLVGFLARTAAGIRHWELGYLVRRLLHPQGPGPTATDLLPWWSAVRRFSPRTPRDLERVPRAVDLACGWFRQPETVADLAGRAAQVLATNAMYHAPRDADGAPRYAPDFRPDALADDEVPEVTLACDGHRVVVEARDRFGHLPRERVFAGLLRPEAAAAHAGLTEHRSGLGFFRLFYSASALRIDVTPGRETLVSWVHEEGVTRRTHQGQGRSVYVVGPAAPDQSREG